MKSYIILSNIYRALSISMTETQKSLVLNFLNIFLTGNDLKKIDDIGVFTVNKPLLINSKNILLFTNEQIDELSLNFEKFREVHDKSSNSLSYMIAVIGCLTRALNSAYNSYMFYVKDICTIEHKVIKQKTRNMCSCLFNSEVRRKARELDETIVCICGLFQYKEKSEVTHLSYGDVKGAFEFTNPDVLYDFILKKNVHKIKYLFVEKRTTMTQAYFDLDFKLEKHGLKEYLSDEKIPELTSHIIKCICEVLSDEKYIYADKTTGHGVHLYFPNLIVSRKQLIEHTSNVMEKIINKNIYAWDEKVASKIYKCILDLQACNNGLCLMYQDKNGAHYKINKTMSTYEKIPENELEQLKLCSLRI